jgi:peroxiredoxin
MKQIFMAAIVGFSIVATVMATNAPPATAVSTNTARQLKPFVLKDQSGKDVKSAVDFKGKNLLLFFFMSWAEPCAAQVPALVELQKKHRGEDFTVVGIALDERPGRDLKFFTQRNKVNFPVLLADMLIVENVGGITEVPTLCLVDPNGMFIMKEAAMTDKDVLEEVLKVLREHQKKGAK